MVITMAKDNKFVTAFEIEDYLVKPATRKQLLSSLEQAGVDPKQGRRILVVDDDLNAFKLVMENFHGLGYELIHRITGESAIELVEENAPDAIILDLRMPGMDGFEFLDKLKKIEHGKHIPVIVWSAKDLSKEERALLKLQAQALLEKKPGSPIQMIEFLRSLVPTREKAHGA